ncbi:MAG: hypothetical protein NZL90_02965 [Aquificaceae bacterium]|nr:hypothetical protein [Aquificaceae bacterium]MDW8237223.1 hypothetical protein [Aquificaceae bacterium]
MCDLESLNFALRDELLRIFKEAETPQPVVKITSLQSAKICGLANLAKVLLYFEKEGYLSILDKEEHFQNWEFRIEPAILDLIFGYN